MCLSQYRITGTTYKADSPVTRSGHPTDLEAMIDLGEDHAVVRCWTCGQLGHVRRNCTKARSQETNSISPGAIQVKGCVDEKETTILIDTGYAVSIVKRSFIGGHRPLDGHGTSLTVSVANGEPLKILK